jgi:hypothetical protein
MLFQIYGPAYVSGQHLGDQASTANPKTIDIPEGTPVSIHWQPLDEAALKAHGEQIEDLCKKLVFGLDPDKDKAKIAHLVTEARKRYTRKLVKAPEPKAEIKEIETNVEVNERGKGKVVGRASDRSPV